jgi:hypothetical protein
LLHQKNNFWIEIKALNKKARTAKFWLFLCREVRNRELRIAKWSIEFDLRAA